tara:strand:+ start:781 stop:1248 length:468 start_codon:yes stop_codon:yes gene_type:complete
MDGIVKVCFVSIRAYPLFDPKCRLNHGGAEVDLYNYAQELVKDKKYIVSFMVVDVGQDLIEQHNGIKLIKAFSLKKKLGRYFSDQFYCISLLREKTQISLYLKLLVLKLVFSAYTQEYIERNLYTELLTLMIVIRCELNRNGGGLVMHMHFMVQI